jgi:hypothetical protein
MQKMNAATQTWSTRKIAAREAADSELPAIRELARLITTSALVGTNPTSDSFWLAR